MGDVVQSKLFLRVRCLDGNFELFGITTDGSKAGTKHYNSTWNDMVDTGGETVMKSCPGVESR